jgi:hypothetical protein
MSEVGRLFLLKQFLPGRLQVAEMRLRYRATQKAVLPLSRADYYCECSV